MDIEERVYIERRATQELAGAKRALSPAAARAHYRLSTLYLCRLFPQEGPDMISARMPDSIPFCRMRLDLVGLRSTASVVIGPPRARERPRETA